MTSNTFARVIAAVVILVGGFGATAVAQTVDLEFNFRHGKLGWTTGFAGYPPATNQSGFYQLDSGVLYAPRKLTRTPVRSLMIQGQSNSSALLMFLKRKLTTADGIVAGRTYRVEYVMKMASNAATGCVGAGSPPGEGVTIRAGASSVEPVTQSLPNGWLEMNIDLATATSPAGNIANGLDCEIAYPVLPYVYIARAVQHSNAVTATQSGELWLFLGTRSGFQGLTRLYYQIVSVKLIPVAS